MVRHLVAADGGDPDAVITVDAGYRELTVDDIAAGEADATFGTYWSWDALRGDLPEEQRLTWPVDEIGAPTTTATSSVRARASPTPAPTWYAPSWPPPPVATPPRRPTR